MKKDRRQKVDSAKVLATLMRTGSYQETAKVHRITRQRVFQIAEGKAVIRRIAVPVENNS